MRPSGVLRLTPSSVIAPAVVLTFVGLASAQGPAGGGPELSGPTGMPAPVVSSPEPSPPRRAVMAVPGLMGQGAARPSIVSRPLRPPVEAPGAPDLDAPLEMPGVLPPARSPSGVASRPVVDPIPIEITPLEGLSGTRPGGASRRSSTAADPAERATTTPGQASVPRRGRLFGLFPVQPPPATPSSSRESAPGRAAVDDLRHEPAAQASLRGRIERQARVAVGDRARSIDVLVEGRSARVQARGVKFLQKRAVRKSLESLPALSGLRSTIEVLD